MSSYDIERSKQNEAEIRKAFKSLFPLVGDDDLPWAACHIGVFLRHRIKEEIDRGTLSFIIGAGKKPMSEYSKRPGELLGTNWLISRGPEDDLRHVGHDTNSWKTFVQSRLALPAGSKGALLLYGSKAFEHRMLCDHLAGEHGTPTEGQGRQLIEWARRPNAEVHLLDCLVGNAVAASVAGCGKSMGPPPKKKRRASYREPVYLS